MISSRCIYTKSGLFLGSLDIAVCLSYTPALLSDGEEGESCWMSCLQRHQLAGAHKGVWTDVSKLLVAV